MARTPLADKPTLRGDAVTVRPICAEDADVIGSILRTDSEVARFGSFQRGKP